MKYLTDDELKSLISQCECAGAGFKSTADPDWKDIIESLNELLDKRSVQDDILDLLDKPN